ncbi:MAG TPA: VOC family protein [Verrucomicrobiae bacterium]|jgi:predicted enzyme related to lactoylglutathione lyase
MLQFSHVLIYVKDMERAAKWYEDILGFDVQHMSAPHYATLYNEPMSIRLDLHPDPSGQNVGRGSMVYFASHDLDDAIDLLRRQNVAVSEPRQRGESPRFTEFADSEGNPLGLYEMPLFQTSKSKKTEDEA